MIPVDIYTDIIIPYRDTLLSPSSTDLENSSSLEVHDPVMNS